MLIFGRERMKKILFICLLVLTLGEVASAKKYYSDYSEFTEYSEEEVLPSDIVNVEVKKVYNKYYNYFTGTYCIIDECDYRYPYVNTKLYKETAFSEWNSDYPNNKVGRVIENKIVCDNNECTNKHVEYRYKDRFYLHFYIDSKLLSKDSTVNGYIKDENDYVTYYRYQTRNKLEINDNITIVDKNSTINDFIFSNKEYKIVGNIDYTKNGIYNISVVTDFINVPVSVNVMIVDNINNFYNNKLMDKDIIIDKLNKEIKNNEQIISDKIDIENKLKENITTLKKEIDYNNINRNELINDNKNLQSYQKELENSINIYRENILNYQKESAIYETKLLHYKKINDIYRVQILDKDNVIDNLNVKINNYKLNSNREEDFIKKLKLCNDINDSLNKKLTDNKNIKDQNSFYIIFIFIILSLISFSVLKIKSIKKNN